MLASVLNIDTYELSEVIKTYTNALDLLDDYDHQRLNKPKGNDAIYRIEYDEARRIIDSMKFKNDSNVFYYFNCHYHNINTFNFFYL